MLWESACFPCWRYLWESACFPCWRYISIDSAISPRCLETERHALIRNLAARRFGDFAHRGASR
jgi:hypothetical protein